MFSPLTAPFLNPPENIDVEATHKWLATYDAQLRLVIPGIKWHQQQQWSAWIDVFWKKASLSTTTDDLPFRLARLAAALCQWKQASTLYQEALRISPEEAVTWHNLAISQWQRGLIKSAQEAMGQAIQLKPAHRSILASHRSLLAYNWSQTDRFIRFGCEEPQGPLTLLPLHPIYAAGIYYHQRCGSIASWVGLPQLDSVADARRWIGAQAREAHQISLALLHHEFGPIGFGALTRKGTTASIYYWVSCDLQGQGFGSWLIGRLKDLASQLGIIYIFAIVLPKNAASQRVLIRQEFVKLPFEARENNAVHYVFAYSGGGGLSLELAGALLKGIPHSLQLRFTEVPQ